MDTGQEQKYTQSLYNSSYSQIVFKNFLAGFSFSFGKVFVQLCLYLIAFLVLKKALSPILVPMYQSMNSLIELLGKTSQIQQPKIDTNQIQDIFDSLKIPGLQQK